MHEHREGDSNHPCHGRRAATPPSNIIPGRSYQGFCAIRRTDNVANALYYSLQVNWSRRFRNGLQFGASYTLSKSMDSGSNQRDVVPDTYDISMLWGPSEFDVRHIFVANYLYQLPFLH